MENKKANWAMNIILSVIIFMTVSLVAYMVDRYGYNSKWYNKWVYGSDCNYVVPSGYKIVFVEPQKKYAVKVLTYGDLYLYNGRSGITDMFSHIAEPSLFDDTCGAKGYLKAYFKQNEPSVKSFK